MQRWEDTDPAELARTRARIDWLVVWAWVGAFGVSLAFWYGAALCYSWAVNR